MPDWSYHPVFKPLLFKLPPKLAKDITLKAMGCLGSWPGGIFLLDLLGHMMPKNIDLKPYGCLHLMGQVGLSGGFVWNESTLKAFSHFGFSYIEIGPITVEPLPESQDDYSLNQQKQSIQIRHRHFNPGLEQVKQFLEKARKKVDLGPVKISARLSLPHQLPFEDAVHQLTQLTDALVSLVDWFHLDITNWDETYSKEQQWSLIKLVSQSGSLLIENQKPLFLYLSSSQFLSETFDAFIHSEGMVSSHIQGIVISSYQTVFENKMKSEDSWRETGETLKEDNGRLHHALTLFKARYPHLTFMVDDMVMEPQDALTCIQAGADACQIYSRFVFSGPGFAKRVNAYLNFKSERVQEEPLPFWNRFFQYRHSGWFALTLLALGLIFAAILVLYVGMTTVILPYDEAFLGGATESLHQINPKLLSFMQHDRVTLGGTSLSGAILFFFLSFFGVRQGHHWAFKAAKYSMIAGFLSFFLYLGFNYFDPLHALVCILVLPFFIFGIFNPPIFIAEKTFHGTNDFIWRRALIGQLLFVMIGFGLLVAGIVISGVGCSSVFVKEDLLFMHTTSHHLLSANPKLLPLIAHDRASFGGSLWGVGTAEFLLSLYGYQAGQRWVWWALLLGGLPGFVAVMGIHFAIGYTHFVHLFPAYLAFLMYIAGLILSYPLFFLKKTNISV